MGNLTDIEYGIGKYLAVTDGSGIPGIGANRKNLDLLNFKLATNNSYTIYKFKDGMIDAYFDESGVDTGSCINQTYDGGNDLYSPTGGNSNMTLISVTQTANATPIEGRLLLYEEDVDAITVGTDIKGYISRDAGSTWSLEIGLTEDATYESGKRLLSGSIDISGLAGTTSMRYKVRTFNNKDLKLHGASLLWG